MDGDENACHNTNVVHRTLDNDDGVTSGGANIADDDLEYITITVFDASSPGSSFIVHVPRRGIVRDIIQRIIEVRSLPLDTDHVWLYYSGRYLHESATLRQVRIDDECGIVWHRSQLEQ